MLKKAPKAIFNFINENKIKNATNTTNDAIEKLYFEKHNRKSQTPRTDLIVGDMVVVLEGRYTGSKVIFLKQTNNNMAIVSGVKEINDIGIFKINERYLFKLSVNIGNISTDNITDDVYESKLNEKIDDKKKATINEAINNMLIASISKIDFLKGYMVEPFQVNREVEFYSQKY